MTNTTANTHTHTVNNMRKFLERHSTGSLCTNHCPLRGEAVFSVSRLTTVRNPKLGVPPYGYVSFLGKQKFYDQNIQFIDSEVHRFSKIYEPAQNSRRQIGHMTQVPKPKTRHITDGVVTKFGRQGDLAPGICAPLHYYKHRTVTRPP
jgi:hypothetical protein